MVQFNPWKDHDRRRKNRCRTFVRLPLSTRVRNWARKVHERSSLLPRPLRMQIPKKYADQLGWGDNWVEIDAEGNLFKDAVLVEIPD